MDWEDKFSSIVKETESNLARVRERLGPCNLSRTTSGAVSGGYSPYFDSPPKGNKPYSSTNGKSYQPRPLSGLSSMGRVASVPNISSSARSRSSLSPVKSVGLPTNQSSSQNSPALINVLFERIEHQTEMVNSLSLSVRSLEKDRVNQSANAKRMEEEISRLNERLRERGVDLETERKLEQFKREVYSQLEAIQNQSRIQKSMGERHIGDASSSTVARDLQESKRLLQEDNDSLRREFDHMKTRMGKVELDLQSVIADTTDVLRRHDRLDRTVMSISENQRSQSRSLSEVVERKHVNDSEHKQLRSHVEQLSRQVAEIEAELELIIRTDRNKPMARSSGSTSTSKSGKKSLKNRPLINGNYRTPNVKRSNQKFTSKSLDLSLSDISDTDLSLTTLELNSPSDSELVSLQLDNSSRGFGDPLSSDKDESLSSLDSDDLLGEFSH